MKAILKPCPFCGGVAELHERYGDCGSLPAWYEVACFNPSCNFGCGDTEQEAVDGWNTRADEVYRRKVAALVEAAKEVPEKYRLYRAKGVLPAPDQYRKMVAAITRLEAAIAALGENP
jgi:hypothetical protein